MADFIQYSDIEQSYHTHALCSRQVEFPERGCEEESNRSVGDYVENGDRKPDSPLVEASFRSIDPTLGRFTLESQSENGKDSPQSYGYADTEMDTVD